MYGHYKCINCGQSKFCNAERTMVDSSIILAIVKGEDRKRICEERLNKAKKNGGCFITHIGLGEIYKEIFSYIKNSLANDFNSYNDEFNASRHKVYFINQILHGLEETMKEIEVSELNKDSLEKISNLLGIRHLRMGNRDRIILGIAEANLNNYFIFIDKDMERDIKTLKDKKFNINLESLN